MTGLAALPFIDLPRSLLNAHADVSYCQSLRLGLEGPVISLRGESQRPLRSESLGHVALLLPRSVLAARKVGFLRAFCLSFSAIRIGGQTDRFCITSSFGSSNGRGLLLNSLFFSLFYPLFTNGDAQSRSQCMPSNSYVGPRAFIGSVLAHHFCYLWVEAFFCRLPRVVFFLLLFYQDF